MSGWRPHTDQVGQTGNKIAPEIYIACGVSGATQHIAGCKGAKRILAVNTDPEAPIMSIADYAVVGDLHEVLPAISAELRRRRGDARRQAEAVTRPVSGFSRTSGMRVTRPSPPSRSSSCSASPASLFGRRALMLTRLVRLGKPVQRFDDVPQRVRNEAVVVLGQKKLFQRLGPGLIHAFIFWGFLVLFPTIVMALIAAVAKGETLPWLGSQGWFALLVDLFVVLVLVGVTSAFWIRKVQRPERFKGSHLGEADLILGLIALIVLTLLLWHAALIATGLNEWPAGWSPVSNAIAQVFGEGTWAEVRERIFVWAHVLLVVGFLAYLPHSKHLHIATAAVNVWFGRTRSRGRLEPLDFTVEDESAMRFGAAHDRRHDVEADDRHDVVHRVRPLPGRLPGLRDRQGAVAEAPDHGAARPALRGGAEPARGGDGGERSSRPPLVPNAVSDDVVWDCVTCGACVQECPVAIEHVDHIVDLRRHLVMVEGRFPAEGETMLRDVERSQNPWGKPQAERADWTEGLDVRVLQPGEPPPEVLYWVGCAASFDERARTTAQSTAKLLQAAGVDFADPRPARVAAPATRPGGWGTSTRSSRTPSRTWRR